MLLSACSQAPAKPTISAFAGRLGCEEGLEQFLKGLRRNTNAVVAYPDLGTFAKLTGRDPKQRTKAAQQKANEEYAKKNVDYYQGIQKASTVKQTLALKIARSLRPCVISRRRANLGSGTASGVQLAYQKPLATLNIEPEAATDRQVFDMLKNKLKTSLPEWDHSRSSQAIRLRASSSPFKGYLPPK